MDSSLSSCGEKRIPTWLKTGLPDAYSLGAVRAVISQYGINTICFEAACPNKRSCFEERAVTFLAGGARCSRTCRFCNVAKSRPGPLSPTEPERIAGAVRAIGLDYVIITSVTRDDLPDGGAAHIAACVRSVKGLSPAPPVEVLAPDFGGKTEAVDSVVRSGPDVFGHNMETVERLYPLVRSGACYSRSLRVLEAARRCAPGVILKSGLILGMGETVEEVKRTLRHLAGVGCDVVAVGQYMQPSLAHLPVRDYIEPSVFDHLASCAGLLGLVPVCGPQVRSSFRAGAAFHEAKRRRQRCE